jgi:hypothetical protein
VSNFEKAVFIIMVQGPSASGTVGEAERIKGLYPNRASVSRPLPHNRRCGWWVVYIDVYPKTDLPMVLEGGL